MTPSTIDFARIIPRFDAVLKRGLCKGVGKRDGKMCIEAAICYAMDLPHGDEPTCVTPAVRSFKISLNDSNWSSDEARAKGLRNLGIAQIGSLGVVDGVEFSKLLAERTIRVLLPDLFRRIFPKNQECLKAADRCEKEGSYNAAAAAADAAANAAANARYAATAAAAAADAAANAKKSDPDAYLLMSAEIALGVLRDLKSPGCAFLGV